MGIADKLVSDHYSRWSAVSNLVVRVCMSCMSGSLGVNFCPNLDLSTRDNY